MEGTQAMADPSVIATCRSGRSWRKRLRGRSVALVVQLVGALSIVASTAPSAAGATLPFSWKGNYDVAPISKPAHVSTADEATFAVGGYRYQNDLWGPGCTKRTGECPHQRIAVADNATHTWSVQVYGPTNRTTGITQEAVFGYPDVEVKLHSLPVSTIRTFKAAWAEKMPQPNLKYYAESAFTLSFRRITLTRTSFRNPTRITTLPRKTPNRRPGTVRLKHAQHRYVMIWTDIHTAAAKGKLRFSGVTMGGIRFNGYGPAASSPKGNLILVPVDKMGEPRTLESGTVNVAAIVKALQTIHGQHYVTRGSTLQWLQYGVETRNTFGQKLCFLFKRFQVMLTKKTGS